MTPCTFVISVSTPSGLDFRGYDVVEWKLNLGKFDSKILGRVPIIVYGSYGPTPASKTTHFFALVISRPSSCVHREFVKNSFDDSEVYRKKFWVNENMVCKMRCPCFLRENEESIDSS